MVVTLTLLTHNVYLDDTLNVTYINTITPLPSTKSGPSNAVVKACDLAKLYNLQV